MKVILIIILFFIGLDIANITHNVRKMLSEVNKMFEVTYSIEGIIHKITINASDTVRVMNIMTNMFGTGKVQIINIRRI